MLTSTLITLISSRPCNLQLAEGTMRPQLRWGEFNSPEFQSDERPDVLAVLGGSTRQQKALLKQVHRRKVLTLRQR